MQKKAWTSVSRLSLCAPGMGAVYRVRVPNHEGSSNG